jgi:ribosomal protein S14
VLWWKSAIASKQERYQAEGVSTRRCSNCGKPGHSSNKCYWPSKVEARVNTTEASGSENVRQVSCLRCGEKGHIARRVT